MGQDFALFVLEQQPNVWILFCPTATDGQVFCVPKCQQRKFTLSTIMRLLKQDNRSPLTAALSSGTDSARWYILQYIFIYRAIVIQSVWKDTPKRHLFSINDDTIQESSKGFTGRMHTGDITALKGYCQETCQLVSSVYPKNSQLSIQWTVISLVGVQGVVGRSCVVISCK